MCVQRAGGGCGGGGGGRKTAAHEQAGSTNCSRRAPTPCHPSPAVSWNAHPAIHAAAVKFPDGRLRCPHAWTLGTRTVLRVDVVLFVREMVETYTHLRESVMQKRSRPLEAFSPLASPRRVGLVGEYRTRGRRGAGLHAQGCSASPCSCSEAADDDATSTPSRAEGRPLVLADGSRHAVAMVDGVAAGGTNAAAAVPKLRGCCSVPFLLIARPGAAPVFPLLTPRRRQVATSFWRP